MHDAEAYERLSRLLGEVEALQERRRRVPDVQAGSRTAEDDRVTAPYQLSHVVTMAADSALDHLQALRALLVDAQALHASAPFTLIRAAIEGAAQALWLLAPDPRETRVQRRLQLAVKDAKERDEAGALLGEVRVGDNLLEARRQRFADLAERAGVAREHVLARPPGMGRMVAAADEAVPGPDRLSLEFLWRMSSGYAHGQPWAMITAGAKELVPESQVDDVSQYVITAEVSTVWMAAAASMIALKEAFRLHDQHRLLWVQRTRPGS